MNLAARYKNLEDPLRSERRVELVLIAVVLLLALQLLWGGFRALFPALPEPVQPRPDSLQVIQFETGEQVDPELRAQIAARPLFWASRRPPEAEADTVAEAKPEAAASKPGKIDGVQLAGVFGSGESAGIIVIAKGKKRRLMVGEEINGWKLQSVEPNEALFVSDGRKTVLTLKQVAVQVSRVASPEPAAGPQKTRAGAGEQEQAVKTRRAATPADGGGSLTLGRRAIDK